MRKKEKEVTDIHGIELIIQRSDVCRLAFADMNEPYIVTMNFGYSGGEKKRLYFHCAREGRKIEMIRKNNRVCFEMDTDHSMKPGKQACDYGWKYSSVVGYGYISIVADREEKIEGLNYIMSHYAGNKSFAYKHNVLERTTILRLEITEMTGKKS
jgi:nitroimidazol reductase NimA-like FMN-containing flavoprotein (pyridoxamine 5'-phosphate oxidase superfamily)